MQEQKKNTHLTDRSFEILNQFLFPSLGEQMDFPTELAGRAHCLSSERLLEVEYDDPDYIYHLLLETFTAKYSTNQIISDIRTYQESALLIRDARKQDKDPTLATDTSVYNYIMIGLSYFQAYLILLEIYAPLENFEKTRDRLMHVNVEALCFCKQLKTFKSQMFKNAQRSVKKIFRSKMKALVKQLADAVPGVGISRRTAEKYLDEAKNWIGLQRAPVPVATLDVIYGKTVIRLDTPQFQLTPELRDEFENCQSKTWFKGLTPIRQNLVVYYCDKILDGRVIPSQLRNCVPGVKNSYKQTVAVVDEEQKRLLIIGESFHSGTPVFLDHQSDDEMQRLTKLSLEQQRLISGCELSHMLTLNAEHGDALIEALEWLKLRFRFGFHPPFTFKGCDSDIVRHCKQATLSDEGKRWHHANICLNGFRKFFPNDNRGIFFIIQQAETLITSITKASRRMLMIDVALPKEIKASVGRIRFLIEKVRRSLVATKRFTADRSVQGLDSIAYVNQLCYEYNTLLKGLRERAEKHPESKASSLAAAEDLVFYLPDNTLEDFQTIASWYGCASGENRTGFAIFHTSERMLQVYFKSLIREKKLDIRYDENVVRDALAFSGHVQIMTGFQGSIMGTGGIRYKSKGSAPIEYTQATVNSLLSKHSDIKSLNYVRDKQFPNAPQQKRSIWQKIKALLLRFLQKLKQFTQPHPVEKEIKRPVVAKPAPPKAMNFQPQGVMAPILKAGVHKQAFAFSSPLPPKQARAPFFLDDILRLHHGDLRMHGNWERIKQKIREESEEQAQASSTNVP